MSWGSSRRAVADDEMPELLIDASVAIPLLVGLMKPHGAQPSGGTRDRRAEATYRRLGVPVELLT